MNDYDFGKNQEIMIWNLLKKKYTDLEMTSGRFNDWDYIDKENVMELKSRRITSYEYADTIIGSNKIYKGKNMLRAGLNVKFIFNFTDGVYYFDLEESDTFKESFFNGKLHSFINIRDKLKILNI